MKKVVSFLIGVLLGAAVVFPTQAAFTSLYVFGDSISTTTNNPAVGPYYYGQRYSNGRVWVEALAQQQGLAYDPNKNWSYFGDTSTDLVAHVNSFKAPSDAGTALFVIWVNCADLYYPANYSGSSSAQWNNAINQSQINHYKAATNLYFAKGARTLIMPNVVDLSTIPAFNAALNGNFIHQQCVNYNIAFSNTLNQIRATCPNLTIYSPDFFTLLANTLAHPSTYSVYNAQYLGLSVDALDDPLLLNKNVNGPGTNYIFWDEKSPSAKVHMWMADLTQQLISPVNISQITVFPGSNRLDVVNMPVGQNGLILGCTNLALLNWMVSTNWTTNGSFAAISTTQSVFVVDPNSTPPPGQRVSPRDGPFPPGTTNANYTFQLYQLKFPYTWNWP